MEIVGYFEARDFVAVERLVFFAAFVGAGAFFG
jgi:hypothetical protein